MTREELLQVIYDLFASTEVILSTKDGKDKISHVVEGLGYKDRIADLLDFLDKEITEKEFNIHIEKQAFFSHVEALEKIIKYMDMSKGYAEMEDINLTIATEDFHLEKEVDIDEMDSKETKTTA